MNGQSRDIRICFLGESFVTGTGDRTHLGWAGRLCGQLSQQGYSITYYNLGIRRETSHQLLQRWQSEVDRRFPADTDNRIVFCFGVNDTTLERGQPRVSLADSIRNTQEILTRAQQQYSVLQISPLPIADRHQNQRIQSLSEQFSQLCQDLQIPYLDALTPLSQSPTWMAAVAAIDGAHPNAAGYIELTQLIQNWSVWQNWFSFSS